MFLLDHVFILVEPGGDAGDKLVELGLAESAGRDHPGQGTSNRRFVLDNGMIELLWVRDATEAGSGAGRDLHFKERTTTGMEASPFGLIFCADTPELPFEGWSYYPDFLPDHLSSTPFHVGVNSTRFEEPLCILSPFEPISARPTNNPDNDAARSGPFRTLSSVRLTTTTDNCSSVLQAVNRQPDLSIRTGAEHLLEVTLDDGERDCRHDFRPDLPLILYW